jgi:hypothetical protein
MCEDAFSSNYSRLPALAGILFRMCEDAFSSNYSRLPALAGVLLVLIAYISHK